MPTTAATETYTYLIGPDAAENDDIARRYPTRLGYGWDDAGDVGIGWCQWRVGAVTYIDDDGVDQRDDDYDSQPCSLADVLAALPDERRAIRSMHAEHIAAALEAHSYRVESDDDGPSAERLACLAELLRELA